MELALRQARELKQLTEKEHHHKPRDERGPSAPSGTDIVRVLQPVKGSACRETEAHIQSLEVTQTRQDLDFTH